MNNRFAKQHVETAFTPFLSFQAVVETPLGKLGIQHLAGKLTRLEWLPESATLFMDTASLTKKIKQNLQRYFSNGSQQWDFPLAPTGSCFQQRVWQALQKIPFGEVVTYGQLAKQLQSAPRAIGQACRTNPICIIIPCHRVVATQGLGGYGGKTAGGPLDIKKWLLQHEGYNNN